AGRAAEGARPQGRRGPRQRIETGRGRGDGLSRRRCAGRLDFLVNNAGTPATAAPIPFSELDRLTEDFWQTILSTNLIGPFRCTHAAVGALRQAKGAICSTASIAGVQGSGSSIPYATSKAGVINLTRSLARTLAP